ncbi:MAG TPA: dihydrodipicolinate synthase family protein [Candidatus Dormibacteraeota bacterium]|nr:dihydrodipicolinate synthase family protein [Candidatus Dormibacteraeota bacterium]
MATIVRGIVGTPVTPFTSDNRLDEATAERLTDFLIRNGAHGIAVPMHIGESLNMSSEERKRLAEITVKVAAGRVPVFINVSLSGTDEVIALARHAQSVGAAGVVVLTPYHWQPTQDALFEHYVAIGSAIEIGIIAYNFPLRLGVTITPGLVRRLIARLENFVGLKDASVDMEYFTEICHAAADAGRPFSVFTGVEYTLPSLVLGGAGSFSACGGVAPHLARDLYAATARGDYDEARRLQYTMSGLWTLIKADYPATIKAAMEIMGRPVGVTRRPIPQLSADAKKKLEERLGALGILESQPHGW